MLRRGPQCRRPTVPTGYHPRGGPRPARDQPGSITGPYPPGAGRWVPAGVHGGLGATRPSAALRAFFPVEEAPLGDLPGEGEGPEPQAGDLDLGLELDADEDDEYLLS